MKKRTLLIALLLLNACIGCATTELQKSSEQSAQEKSLNSSSGINILDFNSLPTIGSVNDSSILLGGFSGLEFKDERKDALVFTTITDRGANGFLIENHPTLGKNVRPFLIPSFSPRVIDFELRGNVLTILKQEELLSTNGDRKISGLPPVEQTASNASHVEAAYKNGQLIKADPLGFDTEGVCTDRMGRTWVSDEYLPSVAVFDVNKKLIKRFTPGNGIPKAYAQRNLNRGFEGLTCTQDSVYAMLQSPMPIKGSKNEIVVRILKININATAAESQFAYPLDDKKVDKIGDITNDDQGNFYVIEQNGKTGGKSVQKIYKIQLSPYALDVKENPELWSPAQVKAKAVKKTLVKDLSGTITSDFEKLEGIAIYKNKIYIITDNDFGLDGDSGDPERPFVSATKKPRLIWFEIENQ